MTLEDAWLAGIVEGEAYIGPKYQKYGKTNSLRICVQMTDQDIIERVAQLWGSTWREVKPHIGTKVNHKTQYATEICGPRANEFVDRVWPLFSQRRQARIEAVRSGLA